MSFIEQSGLLVLIRLTLGRGESYQPWLLGILQDLKKLSVSVTTREENAC